MKRIITSTTVIAIALFIARASWDSGFHQWRPGH